VSFIRRTALVQSMLKATMTTEKEGLLNGSWLLWVIMEKSVD